MPNTKGNEIHLIFFHGLGDDYENATAFCEEMQSELMHPHGKPNFHTHAHKYPAAFQNYIPYALASLVCLGTSILLPAVILLTNRITARTALLAVLAALACVFLSMLLLMIPFLNKNQSLSKSSIEQISQLIDKGVKSENIVLFGHSFGGAIASEVLRHFANRDVKLGGIVFTSAFSSFHTAVKHFPMPQTKILSILPSFLLKGILKALNLEFDIVDNLRKSQNEKMPIVVINHAGDRLIPLPAQLANAIRGDPLLNGNLIKIHDDLWGSHNDTLDSGKLTKELKEVVLSKVTSRTR
ncbi:alpha/beta hydrolase family protein [Wolbachia endosymbiont of Cylisticus convexus]|uniref:alpha/beta hydrolase n=1 Tax=Wolbachia endosymbiont of Cylisticus convexus TaxID=118728 RepID=UPI001F3DB78A|nr:alpha/beta hydrolase [Wolbachia endosymbiont of Cylisticus convexus]